MKVSLQRLFLSVFILFCTTSFSQNVNVQLRGQLPYPGQTLSNLWGYADSLGNEYALVGAQNGISIVDVTNPSAPFQVAQISGPSSTWREIKTHGKYAYITTESGNSGLQIVDLRLLPSNNLPSKYWAPNIAGTTLETIHALHIEDGFAYLYGSNVGSGSALIADLTDPWNPVYVGSAGGTNYIHDGYVRNDTLYAGHIYAGYVGIYDVSDKVNPVLLQTQSTPSNFTHNTWLSDDSQTLFTTDEVGNSFLTAYDISDLNNIVEVDRIQSNPGSNSVVHNTYIRNDWAVTSWYRDGFTIVDAHRPHNLVQVGNYDTYAGSGNGMDGAWGVYPYLPSGNIVVSNIDEGLFIFTPTYKRAAYLEGFVTDSVCGAILSNVTVTITSTTATDMTDATGSYATGYHIPGTYSVTFSKAGYNSKTISGVVLDSAMVTNLNVTLYSPTASTMSGNVNDGSNSLANVAVEMTNTTSSSNYNFLSDVSGNFSSCNFVAGTYNVTSGAWGYETVCSQQSITSTSGPVNIQLQKGYVDPFAVDLGWTVTGTASTGGWERGEPAGTLSNGVMANPDVDVSGDCSDKAYITGNAGGQAPSDDVDNGSTSLTSPMFDLTLIPDPYVSYYRWFYNGGGQGGPLDDSLIIYLSNGATTVPLEIVTANSTGNSTWVYKKFRIADYLTPTATMSFIAYTADSGNGHLVEAGLDNFMILDSLSASTPEITALQISVYPNPTASSAVLKCEEELIGSTAVITDLTGRIIERRSINATQTSIAENIPAGIYLISLQKGNTVTQIRLIKTN